MPASMMNPRDAVEQGPIYSLRRRPDPTVEWTYTLHFPSYQVCHDLCRRSWTCRFIHHGPETGPNETNLDRNGMAATTHPNPNRQYNSWGCSYQQDCCQEIKIYGPETALVTLSGSTKNISLLLGQRTYQLGRLSHKATPTSISRGKVPTFCRVRSHITPCPQITEQKIMVSCILLSGDIHCIPARVYCYTTGLHV